MPLLLLLVFRLLRLLPCQLQIEPVWLWVIKSHYRLQAGSYCVGSNDYFHLGWHGNYRLSDLFSDSYYRASCDTIHSIQCGCAHLEYLSRGGWINCANDATFKFVDYYDF